MRARVVAAVLRREFVELRRNRWIIATMSILPITLVWAAIGTTGFVADIDPRELRAGIPPQLAGPLQHLDGTRNVLVAQVADQFLFMLMMISLALPSTITAHAIVGEKVERTLEPLLASPIETSELLLGKCLAAVMPATVMTQIAYGITLCGFRVTCPPEVFALTIRPVWLIAFLVVVPAIALLSSLAAIIASSRVNDPRTAQGLVGFLVLPVIGLGVATVLGSVYMDGRLLLAGAACVLLFDVVLLAIAVRIFSREAILTRWK